MAKPPINPETLHSLEMEMSALGSMFYGEKAVDDVLSLLGEDDFFRPSHRVVLRAIRQVMTENKGVDLLTVKQELLDRKELEGIGGEAYLIELMECVPGPANAKAYAEEVLEKATLRRLAQAGYDIVEIVGDPEKSVAEKLNDAEQKVFEAGSEQRGRDFLSMRHLAKNVMLDIDEFMETGEPTLGVSSGFYDLDSLTTGFYGSDLIIVAARPSMGKTSLVLNMALNAAQKDSKAVAFFSLEMSGKQLARRMVSMLSGVGSQVLKKKGIDDGSIQKLADACEHLYGMNIWVDESSDVSGLEIMRKCRRLKKDHGLSLIIVDYLQLMRGVRRTENRVQEVSDIARSLKAVAKELDVPVLALSQLSRQVENRDNKRPQLSDLRESGSIEAEADVVMFIFREQYYKDRENPAEANTDPDRVEEAEIIVSKHRNGPTGTAILGFQPTFARFVNYSRADTPVRSKPGRAAVRSEYPEEEHV